jgi:single-stranded-DNA-specific exonuclease
LRCGGKGLFICLARLFFMPIAQVSRKWVVAPRDENSEATLQRELGIPSIVAALLSQRGITDPAEAERFLFPKWEHLHDATLLPDFGAAKNEILGAIERKELIFVHGDYDVDGVTSAAILHRFLMIAGANVVTHVPHRMKEGYGINHSAVELAKEKGAKLFLTCDCGISAHDRVEAAKEAGMRVVVTDHHSIGDTIPEAHAVVNPHRKDSYYPFRYLSGAGVVFKLCDGLAVELGMPQQKFRSAFADLAALGTIADVMPLIDENRVIAKFGLERLGATNKVGIQALKENAGLTGSISGYDVGYKLGPRINAVGRVDDAGLALKLLLETNYDSAKQIADHMEMLNVDRRDVQQKMVEEAIQMVEAQGLQERYLIMVASPDWHAGIVGLVAGRLVERYHRPAFCMIVDHDRGLCKGSARSIPTFSVVDAIRAFPGHIEGGGHLMAAGCSFLASDLEAVADMLDGYARSVLTPEDLVMAMQADLEVDASELDMATMETLALMEPFGESNPEPSFVCRGVQLVGMKPTRNPAHVNLTYRNPASGTISAVAFGLGERFEGQLPGSSMDLFFQPKIDTFSGRKVKWQIKDFEVA